MNSLRNWRRFIKLEISYGYPSVRNLNSSSSSNQSTQNKIIKQRDPPETIDPRPQFSFSLDEKVHKDLNAKKYNPNHHPGRRSVKPLMVPEEINNAAKVILNSFSDADVTKLKEESVTLSHKIWARHLPLNKTDQDIKFKLALTEVLKTESVDPNHPDILPDDKNRLLKQRYYLLNKRLKSYTYNYEQLDFSSFNQCVSYYLARAAPEYAALIKTFRELQIKLPQFSPNTLMDFGSGVGTVIWATDKVWPKMCKETLSVDASSEMLNMQEMLLRKGLLTNPLIRRPNSTHLRQYLPTSAFTKYDLVVSSRSLMELDSMELRIRTLDILWRTVNPGGCFVIIETGNARGFELILEARKYLTEAVTASPLYTRPLLLAPCTHKAVCPLMEKNPKNRLCSDWMQFFPFNEKNITIEPFSYLIFHKPESQEKAQSFAPSWPRIITPVNRCGSHNMLRVCHRDGQIHDLTVTKSKHGTWCKSVSRKAKLGDLMPIEIVSPPEDAKMKSYKDKLSEKNNSEVPPHQ